MVLSPVTLVLLGSQDNPGPLICFLYSVHVPVSPTESDLSVCQRLGQRVTMPNAVPSQTLGGCSLMTLFQNGGRRARWLRMWALESEGAVS